MSEKPLFGPYLSQFVPLKIERFSIEGAFLFDRTIRISERSWKKQNLSNNLITFDIQLNYPLLKLVIYYDVSYLN